MNTGGDGVDFDWEHFSDNKTIRKDQLDNMATFLLALRNGLDKVGLNDKLIVYTTRFNAFFDDSSRP